MLCECGVVYLGVKIDCSFHGFFVHGLALLFSLFLLCHAFVLLNYVWKLGLLLRSGGLFGLELVYCTDEGVFEGFLCLLVRHALLHHILQVALQEVKPSHIVPWLHELCWENNHLIALESFFQQSVLFIDY